MLPVLDPQGRRTGRQAVGFTLALLPVSLCPFLFHLAGPIYLVWRAGPRAGFVWFAFQFARATFRDGLVGARFGRDRDAWRSLPDSCLARARQLFYVSLLYLPLLLAVMVLDKVK